MTKTTLRRIAFASIALPLSFAVAACGSSEGEGALTSGEPIAEIPAPEGQAWGEMVAVTEEGGHLVGNPDAPIRLVEYGSYTCPACAMFSEEAMQPLLEDYVESGRVSYEFRSVPLHGVVDLLLTRLVQCSPKEAAIPLGEQIWGNLDPLLDRVQSNSAALEQAMSLPEDQRMVAVAERGGLTEFFAARGISVEQAEQCLSDFDAIQTLAEDLRAQNEEDGINATPTFLLNGTRLEGSRWSEVEVALQEAGAR